MDSSPSIYIAYDFLQDFELIGRKELEDMRIESRPSFTHHKKLTFNIKDRIKYENLKNLGLNINFLKMNEFGIGLFLEDSKRQSMNNCLVIIL